jgi:hypothetical protein
MATRAEKVAQIDAFMAARKQIVSPHTQGTWQKAHSPNERQLKWPLAIDGVIHPGSGLLIVGDPTRKDRLFFRLAVLCPAAVCRLDFTDETHANSAKAPAEGIPAIIRGEHYHSWGINRRFFRDFDHPVEIRNAVPYEGAGRTFDSILRWFCEDTHIDPLEPDHQLALPTLEMLF